MANRKSSPPKCRKREPRLAHEHDQSVMFRQVLQQIVDLNIRVSVVGILHVRTFSEQSVRFVNKQYRTFCLGCGE